MQPWPLGPAILFRMKYRVAVVLGLSLLPALSADWSPRLAADYMDARQQEWIAWPRANGGAKPCISCHTSVPYLLSRPALRKELGEKAPTSSETTLLASLSSRLDKKTPDGQALGVESVMAALFLVRRDAPGKMSPETVQAFDRMWALQNREGKAAGSWKWYITDLDPWEEPESDLFGAAMAALAVGATPPEYRQRPEVRERIAALSAFIRGPHEPRPLQNWLTVAWASVRLPEIMDDTTRQKFIREILDKQQSDGGWSMQSLGPWKTHAEAPPATTASDAYATAFTAYVLEQTGMKPASEPRLQRALAWLRTHQDPKGGYWDSSSLNHKYPAGSVEIKFMRDAATGYATMALLCAD